MEPFSSRYALSRYAHPRVQPGRAHHRGDNFAIRLNSHQRAEVGSRATNSQCRQSDRCIRARLKCSRNSHLRPISSPENPSASPLALPLSPPAHLFHGAGAGVHRRPRRPSVKRRACPARKYFIAIAFPSSAISPSANNAPYCWPSFIPSVLPFHETRIRRDSSSHQPMHLDSLTPDH